MLFFIYYLLQKDFIFLFYGLYFTNHKKLMVKLINKVAYRLLDISNNIEPCYLFVFQLDRQNIKDIEVLVPGIFRMNILNRHQLMVEILDQRINKSSVHIDAYQINLKHRERLDLLQLYTDYKTFGFNFAHGYALLRLTQ